MASWRAEHPDRRVLGAAGQARFLDQQGAARRDDALVLLVALAAGCLLVAVRPERWRRRLDDVSAVLVLGSSIAGLTWLGLNLADVAGRARVGHWTLGDDNLSAVAGPYTELLADWRERIDARDAVILVGSRDYLLNLVAWSLHPRPLYPYIPPAPIPDELPADELARAIAGLPQGRDAPGRWMVDLEALARGDQATRPALVRLDP